MTDRKSWDEYFIGIARAVAERATCDRKHVGAVLVRDRQIVATGYNGSVRGQPHCDDAGHLMVDGHCVRTVHAEMNALVQAARTGAAVEGSTLYVTAFPCHLCAKLLANAGVVRVVFAEAYRVDPLAVTALAGVELRSVVTGAGPLSIGCLVLDASTIPCRECGAVEAEGQPHAPECFDASAPVEDD